MRRVTRWSGRLSACLAVLVVMSMALGQDDTPVGDTLDRKTLDGLMYNNLKDIINHGANLYNTGDWNGCYRVYEGALMNLKPLLGHRKELQKAIDTAIANAQQNPELPRRAFILREALDKVRADLRGAAPAKKGKTGAGAVDAKTLWGRLGGEAGVTRIVDDVVNAAAPDPKVDFFRRGKYKMSAEDVARMKREIVEQVSEASGGPLKYTGPDMRKVHKGMGITDEQFDALVGHIRKALEKNNVAPADVDAFLGAVNSYRKEIVEPKKSGDKEKKPGGTASIQGTVHFQGKPLPGGTIEFVGENGNYKEPIAADGTYKVEGVKPGEYKISIRGKGAVVPAQYGDPDKSALTFTVRDGKQIHDIDLR